MGIATFEKNARLRLNGVDYLTIRKAGENSWLLEELRTGQVISFEMSDLLKMFERKELVFASNGTLTTAKVIDLSISKEDEEKAKVKLLYVKGTMDVPNTKPKLEAAIDEIWRQYKMPARRPGWVSVWLWKKRYKSSGKDYRSLMDCDERKGNRKSRYPKEVVELCQRSIEIVFLQREKNSVRTTTEKAMILVRDANAERPQGAELPMPTRRLVERMIQQVPAFDKTVAREGREAARVKFRSVRGQRITERPLQRAEMDHTVLDVFVIDERTMTPLGRPYLTVCVDDYTRCILGVNLSFIPPSFMTVAQCLKDCFLPKATLRELYPMISSEWPAHGVMEELVVDNGVEFHSSSLEKTCYSLGIELHYSPRKQPWFKGKIERFFGTLNKRFAHTIPGTTFSGIFEKGDYDPVKNACVTLTDLNFYLRKWIADEYHQEVHSGLGATPFATWKASIRSEEIRYPDDSVMLDVILGTAHKRSLTHKGIEFEGLLYNSQELADLRRKKGSTLQVEIRVDENNIGSIHVLCSDTTRPICVPVLAKEYANGMSLWAHKVCKRAARQEKDGVSDLEKLMEAKKVLHTFAQGILAQRKKGAKRARRLLDSGGNHPQNTVGESRNSQMQLEVKDEFVNNNAVQNTAGDDDDADEYDFGVRPRMRRRDE